MAAVGKLWLSIETTEFPVGWLAEWLGGWKHTSL
jgi:hypothetical protein